MPRSVAFGKPDMVKAGRLRVTCGMWQQLVVVPEPLSLRGFLATGAFSEDKKACFEVVIGRYSDDILLTQKVLLTKNYSEIISFGKITNLTRNSLKMSLFPGHFESIKSLKNYENNSQGIKFS